MTSIGARCKKYTESLVLRTAKLCKNENCRTRGPLLHRELIIQTDRITFSLTLFRKPMQDPISNSKAEHVSLQRCVSGRPLAKLAQLAACGETCNGCVRLSVALGKLVSVVATYGCTDNHIAASVRGECRKIMYNTVVWRFCVVGSGVYVTL
jgi:hypothetical protein